MRNSHTRGSAPIHASAPSLEWKVAEIIERCSGASAVFARFRMACVGCAMAPFETLAEGAAAYGLKPESLLREFRRSRPARRRAEERKISDGGE